MCFEIRKNSYNVHNCNIKLTPQYQAQFNVKRNGTYKTFPFTMQMNSLLRASKKLCEKGNLQDIKSPAPYRKMNSEYKKRFDYTKKMILLMHINFHHLINILILIKYWIWMSLSRVVLLIIILFTLTPIYW